MPKMLLPDINVWLHPSWTAASRASMAACCFMLMTPWGGPEKSCRAGKPQRR